MMQFDLIFESDSKYQTLRIVEPVGIDGNIFTVKQDKYGRDIKFSGEEIDLEFWKGFWDVTETPFLMPDGSVSDQLTMGFEHIQDYRKTYGFEAKISLRISEDGQTLALGRLAFPISENNLGNEIFKAKTVMNTELAKFKRQEDTFVNAFSNVDLYGNPITPCSAFKLLVKALPFAQYSKWIGAQVSQNQVFYGGDAAVVAPFPQSTVEGVQYTYIPFQQYNYLPSTFTTDDVIQLNNEITLVKAKEQLTNVTVKINKANFIVADSTPNTTSKTFSVAYGTDYTPGNFTRIDLEDTVNPILSVTDKDYVVNILEVPKDGFIFIRLAATSDDVPSSTPVQSTSIVCNIESLEITATSTAVDSVCDAVWIYDLMNHNVASVTSLPFVSPSFAPEGKYNLQAAYNGYMIRQLQKPFNNKPKDLFESMGNEINFDTQISETEVFFGHERDFYTNIECGAFEINPNSINQKFNPRAMLNTFEYGWDKYEQDKDEKNTLDSVHTQIQMLFPNEEVNNKRSFKMSHVRDGYYGERVRRENESANPTASISGDDDLFVTWVTPVAPGTKRRLNARMQHYANGSQLSLINDGSYSWLLRGIAVGGQFFIIDGSSNAGTYTITAITRNVLTLSGSPSVSGSFQTQTEYFIQNVAWMTAGSEEYSSVSGIANSTDYPNLNSTPKRNLQEYQEWFAMICDTHRDKDIKFTYRKNDVPLKSTKIGETEVDESTSIPVSSIYDKKLITQNIYEVEAIAGKMEMQQALQMCIEKKGFIRFYWKDQVFRGYFTELKHEIANDVTNYIVEEKFMGDYLTVVKDGNILKVTEIGQNIELGLSNFHYSNGLVMLRDNKGRPLTGVERFEKFKIDGQVYTNKLDFNAALLNLLN